MPISERAHQFRQGNRTRMNSSWERPSAPACSSLPAVLVAPAWDRTTPPSLSSHLVFIPCSSHHAPRLFAPHQHRLRSCVCHLEACAWKLVIATPLTLCTEGVAKPKFLCFLFHQPAKSDITGEFLQPPSHSVPHPPKVHKRVPKITQDRTQAVALRPGGGAVVSAMEL